MPGLQGENVVATQGSPTKRSKLSLKFFHKKETKRALDFSETQTEEPKLTESEELEGSCEQVVYGPLPASPGNHLPREKKENLLPFVGLNNLGNTCYLNSVLQVLHYCPGFREGIKTLYDLSKCQEKPKEEADEKEKSSDCSSETLPAPVELLGSLNSLITSIEELQSSFLLSSESCPEGELATPPRTVLHTLRRLNPMYEGHLQHDAQEVLQCILGYIQEACDTIRKERGEETDLGKVKTENDIHSIPSCSDTQSTPNTDEDGQVTGKRKSDTEVGNVKKKPKSGKSKKAETAEENDTSKPFTRSKRKSSSDATFPQNKNGAELKDGGNEEEEREEKEPKDTDGKRKKRAKLSWLKASGKQPSIFSKFCSVGKISSTFGKNNKTEPEDQRRDEENDDKGRDGSPLSENEKTEKHKGSLGLMEQLFQGQLVLRTRCLECESFTERREDFHDISVPVLDDQASSPDDFSEVSPDPKPELRTLKWAIAQFASVERIVGEDKYFCETCHHYTEAERSLLFDKTPEVITIHLKRFSANGLELDPYAGLSKVNTPLHTPLTLSLEEWSTKPSSAKGLHYQLFAVIMHSGVTISSGHYTSYVRMSSLKDQKLWLHDAKETDLKKERKDGAADYDDGEVSFSQKRRASLGASKSASKKLSEGVGLLGGQRSLPNCELENGSKRSEKAGGSSAPEGSRRRRSTNSAKHNAATGLKKEPEAAEEAAPTSSASAEQRPLADLLKYEGKWLLFDDSEVCLLEEEDFLRACSPETCSSSTPYLLFYKKIPEDQL
ncbi:ubiquitin carboxyl-terminal hydrolase 1 [Oryzias melastigma]|uniref:ubiquitin carboxyl-terminal hydrolase 1 n=1 Tax=Oryzias melastigma TaxID=30732 RepID=UPI000CF823AB|nr:ubiquitin carboxyl-terminal hydrolase 1 [Oryzias melastigma]